MSFKHTTRKTSRGGGGKHPPMRIRVKSHVKALCVKTNRKVSAFARVARYLDLQKAKLLYQSFVASTFKYCPLIWLFCGKTGNENIDKVHKIALRVLLDDHESTFEVLLAKNNETTIHIQTSVCL